MTTSTTTPLASQLLDSPVGPLTIVGSAAGVRAVLWPGDDPSRAGVGGIPLLPGSAAVLGETARQLEAYFAGTRITFDLPLDLHGTSFQLAAWQALAEIPYGETRTYADQAARLGNPAAVRAVGAANGRNPLSIILPCHRVVGSDGGLRGYAGGLEAKAALLDFEREHREHTLLPSPGPVALGGEAAVP
jgi:methylated-DNA-[protein]-cysteine S-methyltransferase